MAIILGGNTTAGPGSTTTTLASLRDVNLGPLSDGQYLKFSSSASAWVNSNLTTDVASAMNSILVGVNGVTVTPSSGTSNATVGLNFTVGGVGTGTVTNGVLNLGLVSVISSPGIFNYPTLTVNAGGQITAISSNIPVTSLVSGGGVTITSATDPANKTGALTITSNVIDIQQGAGITVTKSNGVYTVAATSGGSSINSVTGTLPISATTGSAPVISISQSSASTDGYLSKGDWATFNNKAPSNAPVFTGATTFDLSTINSNNIFILNNGLNRFYNQLDSAGTNYVIGACDSLGNISTPLMTYNRVTNSVTFNANARAVTPLLTDNSTAIATTAFVQGQNYGAPLQDYAALRSYAGTAKSIFLAGYNPSTPPTGIAGQFVYDPTDTTTADNGGTVIVDSLNRRWKRSGNGIILSDWFGTDKTGTTNCTSSLLAFYNTCILTQTRGRITAGTYKISTGVLVFDNGGVDTSWPNIETDGYNAVNFQIDSATENNTAVIIWRNGTATSPSGRYWRGGSHGGITITGSGTGTSYPSQHHFSFTGMWGIKFGWMRSNNCKGNSFYCPPALYGGTNPDPYATSFLMFDGIESNFANGYGFYNANFVGMDSWTVENVRIVQPLLGGWYGIGSGNIINNLSFANITGWAFDDGCQISNIGGSPQRNYFEIAEIDNCQYGIRLNNLSRTKFIGFRFVNRYNTTPNTTSTYWPLLAIDLCGGTNPPNVNNIDLDIFHRLEAGGTISNLGTFLNGNNNGNFIGVNINYDYADNGSLGVTDQSFAMVNRPNSSVFTNARRTSTVIEDQNDKSMSFAVGSSATVVGTSGFATATSRIVFASQRWPTYTTRYNTSNGIFTATRRGTYHVSASLPMALPVGTQVRMGFFTSGTNTVECFTVQYSSNATLQMYTVSGYVTLNMGDQLYLCAVQNTASAVNCVTSFNVDEVRFVVVGL